MEDDFVGAIKIKDGLFIGDEYAAQDFEFVVTNKVTHIINCAGKQIPNYWETVGVKYLTFDWADSETQIVFDSRGEVVNQIFNFIEEASHLGEGTLVHSVKGQSRSCCVLTAFFMKRYRWSLYKTLEFLTSRRSDLEIRTSFYHQLLNLESRLFQLSDGNMTVNWHEAAPEHDGEELILRNTFLNARSAPFDEALVNPQPDFNEKPRKLNWGDEEPSNKTGLTSYFIEDSPAALSAKPGLSSVKSALKGSNKVFHLKPKNSRAESPASSSKPTTNPGLRMNKSMRTFSEGRNSDPIIEDTSIKTVDEKPAGAVEKRQDATKGTQGLNMVRSSSAATFDKGPSDTKGFSSTNDKQNNAKLSNINGNIIHLTVNNYLAPVNNLSNTIQNNNFSAEQEQKAKQAAGTKTDSRPQLHKYNLPSEIKKEEVTPNRPESSQTPDKPNLSTNYLKNAIEKKLSKEYKSPLSSSLIKSDNQPVVAKAMNNVRPIVEEKGAKPLKEYAKPSDIKVNYQVLLKNRETPPPRKRDESKKVLDSPQRKAAATTKSSLSSTKPRGDSNLPYSSYLNNLFSTSLSQLNTVTPSGYSTNYPITDKKTPISTKAAPVTYNLTLSQKAQSLSRPQRASTSQSGDKNYVSPLLGNTNFTSKSKLMVPNEPSSATALGSKLNNYVAQPKANPIRVTHDKNERPHSATPNRSVTPQAGSKRLGTPLGSDFDTKLSEQRTSAPLKTTKHAKKDSGSTTDLLAKYRQRSSSPLQMGYNPVLSSSSISLKSKAKY